MVSQERKKKAGKAEEDRRHLPPLIDIDRDIHVLPKKKGEAVQIEAPSRCQFLGGTQKIVATVSDFTNEFFESGAVVGSKTTAMTVCAIVCVQHLLQHGQRIVYDPGLNDDPVSKILRDPRSAHTNYSHEELPDDPRVLRGENIRPIAKYMHLLPRLREDEPLFSATCGIVNRKSRDANTGTHDILLNFPSNIAALLRLLCGNGQRLYCSGLILGGLNIVRNTNQIIVVRPS